MNVLVIGRSGQLATELARAGWPARTRLTAIGSGQCDIADASDVARVIDENAPDVVINAASYTAVDRAEAEPERAFAVNATGPSHLARAARRRGIPLVHVSTDYVFDGGGDRPWCEDDEPHPLCIYGRSKLAGERAVQSAGVAHLILRTSWLFAAHGHNFVRTMLRLGAERDTLGVVHDQIGCPTPAADLAGVIVDAAARLVAGRIGSGVYHYAGAPPVSWYAFAQAIFELAGDLLPRMPALRPIATADFAAAAARPAYSVLDCGKIEREFGISVPPWQRGLEVVLNELRTRREAP